MGSPAIAALRRLRPEPGAAPGPARERCELCSQPLPERHEHVLEPGSGRIGCACTACALLFDAPERRWRRLPRDSRFLPGFELSGAEWAGLGIPIALAFIWRAAATATVTLAYPSPGGAVRAELEAETWAALQAAHPELRSLTPAVEALLVNRMEKPHQAFIVPLDQAFRLVGLIRARWSGVTGGGAVREALRAFCRELRASCRA